MKMNNGSQPVAVGFLIKHFSFFIILHCRISQTCNSQVKRNSIKVDTYGIGQVNEFFPCIELVNLLPFLTLIGGDIKC